VVGRGADHPSCVRNFLFELLQPRDFDGLLVLSGSLANLVGGAAFQDWLKRYEGVPLVSVGLELASCTSVITDGAPGMKDLVSHLIEQHNHRRIAFVRGPVTSFEAEERFAAYQQVLAKHGIAEDPRLVLHGDWLRESGAAAVRELFDVRGIAVDALSAICCANDYMALGVMDALRDRGINVPTSVAVTGFDDGEIGKCAVPPLTTVQQPTEVLGREGMRRLVGLMNGGSEAKLTRLPTSLVARRSCGCSRAAVLLNKRSAAGLARSFEAAVLERRSLIFAELARSAQGSFIGAGLRWEERLVTALLADFRARSDDTFLSVLDQLMAGLQRGGGDVARVQPMLGTLRRVLLDCAPKELDVVTRIDDIMDAARELAGEWLVRGETLRRIEIIDFARALSRVSGTLLRLAEGGGARGDFEHGLRRMGFRALSLGLFDAPGAASDRCVCLAALEPSGRQAESSHFRSSDFAASGVFAESTSALLVQGVVHDHEPLGLLTVPLGEWHTSLFDQMRETFAIGMRGLRLAARHG
jgi:DNA-binding LacI/PurR family transcriptional regulator